MVKDKLQNRRSFRITIVIVFLLLLTGQTLGQSAKVSPNIPIASFTIEKGSPMLLPITIGDTTGPFILDSGATLHVLDDRFAANLVGFIRAVKVSTAGSPLTAKLFEPPVLHAGILELKRDRPIVCLDLSKASEAVGHEILGAIGMPLFRHNIVTIDFDRGNVEFLDDSTVPQASWGQELSIQMDSSDRAFIEDTAVGSHKLSMLLDTGYSGSLSLANASYEKLLADGLITSSRTAQRTTGSGHSEHRSGRAEKFSIGTININSIVVDESTSNKIGLGLLRRFRTTIDIPRHRIYLARSESFSNSDATDKTGIHMLWSNNRIVVEVVDPDSPAHRAGIVNRDILKEANGTLATGGTLNQLRQQFSGKVGAEQSLTVVRGEREFNVKFSLQDFSNWKSDKSKLK